MTGDVSKPFQASAAAAGKARPPIVGRRIDGVSSLSVAADLNADATRCRRRALIHGRDMMGRVFGLILVQWWY